MSERKDGNTITASAIKEVSIQLPITEEYIEMSSKYMKSWEMDPEELLACFCELKWHKNSYTMIEKLC